MKNRFFGIILTYLLISTSLIHANDTKYYPSIDVKELVLSNGLHVFLRPVIAGADNTVVIRLSAKGGYTSFPKMNKGKAEVAIQAAMDPDSGIDSNNKIHAMLNKNAIETQATIEPFYRVIEGHLQDAKSTPYFLTLLKGLFTQTKIDEKSFHRHFIEQKEKAQLTNEIEEISLMTLIQRRCLKDRYEDDPQDLSLAEAQLLIDKSFASISDYIVVVVGAFDPEEMTKYLEEELGKIPASASTFNWVESKAFNPLETPRIEEVHLRSRRDYSTRVTYQLSNPLTQSDYSILKLACHLIENRLKQRIFKGSADHIHVSYEIPFYPSLETVWMTIQFSSTPSNHQMYINKILEEWTNLRSGGIEIEEIANAQSKEANNQAAWENNKDFWLTTISNYLLWGWKIEDIRDVGQDKESSLRAFFKQGINQQGYSIISDKP